MARAEKPAIEWEAGPGGPWGWMPENLLEKAWELRKLRIYTMREVANQLDVEREDLIEQLSTWLKRKEDHRPSKREEKTE